MPTCQRCSSAIASLVLQRLQKPFIYESNPVKNFHPQEATTCWICAKVLKWLETEHPKLAQSCQTRPLLMEFSVLGFIILKYRHSSSSIFELDIDVTVDGPDKDVNSCKVGVHLVPVTELHAKPLTLFKQGTLDSYLAVAKSWIEKCQNDHAECARNTESYYPTRLLHIEQQSKKVRLINSKSHSPSGSYFTLSHRWAETMPIKLQASTIAQFQKEICLSSLPQSFQDAVIITHCLGISYLWIDALCILQDNDSLEWNIEAQNMAKVYSNALLNISATKASTGQEPILQESCIDNTSSSKISLLSSAQKDYYIVDEQVWEDEIDLAPLNQRGWVFQERFLARRVLHFGPRQLAWECRELDALEIFPEGLHETFKVLSTKKSRIHERLQCPRQEFNDAESLSFAEEFHRLVHDYSRCHLTRYTDKLVAFSGIPKIIQEARADSYHAGVWHRTLPYDLSWFQYDGESDDSIAAGPAFPAPTWSWASVAGAVEFPRLTGDLPRVLIAHWTFNTVRTRGSSFADNTSITLKGFLLPIRINWSEGEVSSFQVSNVQFSEDEIDMPLGPSIYLDGGTFRYPSLKEKVCFLPLFVSTEELHGLVVGKSSKRQTYKRLGEVTIPTHQMLQSVRKHSGRDPIPSTRATRTTRAALTIEEKGQQMAKLIEAQDVVELVLV